MNVFRNGTCLTKVRVLLIEDSMMDKVLLSLLLVFWSAVAPAAMTEPESDQGVHPFVYTMTSDFEWWVDSETHKVNFRRCDLINRKYWICHQPMLLRGIDEQDMPKLMDYYEERLTQSEGSRLYSFLKVLSGSFGAATAYAGALAAISILKDAMPSSVVAGLSSWPVVGSIHLISLGTLSLLLYFTGENLVHLHRQRLILQQFRDGLEKAPKDPPNMHFESQTLFNEFMLTFRRTLYEFTHGGPVFDDNGYLIFQ